jgi:serine/threonine protein kinase
MDYVNGVSLREIINWQAALNPNVLTSDQTVYIIRAILCALDFVHNTARLVHCDVSRGNVLLDRDGKVWLTDFGITTKIGQRPPHFLNKQYAAPEMSGKSQVTPVVSAATDLFSVGMLLYHLHENPNGNPEELMGQQDTEYAGAKSAAELRYSKPLDDVDTSSYPDGPSTEMNATPGVFATSEQTMPRSLKQIRRKCLQIEPTQRYHSVSAMLADLDRVHPLQEKLKVRDELKSLVEKAGGADQY